MKETKRASVVWSGGLVFKGGESGGPETTVDGDNAAAPGPMLTLLLAAASCTGSDVVDILAKMRVALHELRIEIAGDRREEHPRRYTAIRIDFHLRGDGLDKDKAARAIDLSIQKYCSVLHSLAPDISITHGFTLG
jgi:putative redox protein